MHTFIKIIRLRIAVDTRQLWDEFKKGYRRGSAGDKQDRGISSKEGKDALPRYGYLTFQILTLKRKNSSPYQMVWVPAISALTRNLAARVGSCGEISWGTLMWCEDCLKYTRVRHKGDQCGDREGDLAIHANPYEPADCFLLLLAVLMVSWSHAGTSTLVFGDENGISSSSKGGAASKEEAFGNYLHKLVTSIPATKLLTEAATAWSARQFIIATVLL